VALRQWLPVRLVALLLPALLLAGCFSTHVPSNGSHAHAGKSQRSNNGPIIRYVRADDTLYSLGKAFGVDYHLIAKRNHISYPYRIYVGQRLYIDRTAPATDDPAGRHLKAIAAKKKVKSKSGKRKSGKVVTAHSKAHSIGKGELMWPVKGKLTSRFGRRGSRMHDGIDIGAKSGTPIRAAASGEVVYSDSRLSGYGRLVIIRHNSKLFTAYAHNERNLVKRGDHVKKGDTIARVGSTGRASGPHLHFEVRQNSTPVDPLAYLPR